VILKASGKVNRGICGFFLIGVEVVCYAQHCLLRFQAVIGVLLQRLIVAEPWLWLKVQLESTFLHG
jgi:hypothetical protein